MVVARPEERVCDGTDGRNGWADGSWQLAGMEKAVLAEVPVGKLEGIASPGWKHTCRVLRVA